MLLTHSGGGWAADAARGSSARHQSADARALPDRNRVRTRKARDRPMALCP